MVSRRSNLLRPVLTSLAAMLALAACGSAGSEGADTASTTSAAAVVTAAAPSTTTLPATTSAAAVVTTDPPIASTDAAEPIVIDEGGVELVSGQRYRYEIHGAAFEFEGVDGWLASRSGNSFFAFAPGKQPAQAFVSMMRLHDARPSSGPDLADRTGLAVPLDPFASVGDVATGDGDPIFATVDDLPADWLGYLDGLTGIDFSSRTTDRLGGLDGELVTFTVSGLPESPDAMCATPADPRCITFAVELTASYYYSEDDEVTLLLTEAGGVPYEFATGINQRNGLDPSVIGDRDRLVASMELAD